jgi:divalent metal cation (Fe/Co/Zn/Cd) transporter
LASSRAGGRQTRLIDWGHGRELYVWSLIVAILFFGAGAGMAIYEGVTSLSQPNELKNVGWAYGVLGIALVAIQVNLNNTMI